MTFTPVLPASYDEYMHLMSSIEPEQIHEMLNRIRAYKRVALSEDGRKKLQILYGCVVQHFISMAGKPEISLSQLDALVPHIVELSPYVPYYSGALSRARLEKEQEAMRANLKDPVKRSDAWPHWRNHPVLTADDAYIPGDR
jgi:hypothetical protein